MGKTKIPLKLDWNVLLRGYNHGPPPELEIVSENPQIVDAEDFSDQEFHEKTQRIQSTHKETLLKLPEEGERKKLQWAQKDAVEYAKPTQSKRSSFSDASYDFNKPSVPQSSFGAIFSQMLEGQSDNSTCNAFDEELRCFGQGNHKGWRQDGLPVNNGRQGTTTSLRQAPFRSVNRYFIDEDNCGTSSGNCKGIASSSYSPSPPEGNLSARFSEKRRASPIRRTRDSRKRKVETVVLDEEDTRPIQPILKIDEAEGWDKDTKIYYPSRSHPEAVELCVMDLDCLNPGSHLSSPIMNFHIRYLQRPVSPTGRLRGDYHVFNTYFYKKLEEAVSSKRIDKDAYYVKFRKWWKGVDIFRKAYIFLPIHADEHWSLAIICIPAKEDESGPIILHLDSLRYHNSVSIFENIESYLKEEWNYLRQSVQPADVPIADRIWKNLSHRIAQKVIPVPQQKNASDCGLFVLYFMERFIEDAPKRLRRKDIAMFDEQWFQPEDASGLRERIRQLLRKQFELTRVENSGIKSPSFMVDSDE